MSTAVRSRRIVTLDIETVALNPADARGALDALTGRIVCICGLVADGGTLTEFTITNEDEAQILAELWKVVEDGDLLVGHNVLGFDLPFILQRSWILGIQPSRRINLRKYYTDEVIDTMQLWTNWSPKGVKLDTLAGALGCGTKSGAGNDVAAWWTRRDLASIASYCMQDVHITYKVFCRLMYLPSLEVSQGPSAERLSNSPSIADPQATAINVA